MSAAAAPQIADYVRNRSGRLIQLVQELVARPSENRAPAGSESACQEYVAAHLKANGWKPLLYTPTEAPGIEQHPVYWAGRDYAGRPNVGARLTGAGAGGRSLVLSGHIDTVPIGSDVWTEDPFGGRVDGNRLYGRGSNDMKGGIATNLFVIEALRELDIKLAGDLVFETVVDEEFGGVNGTLAGRLMGFNADAAVLSEPTGLRVCPAQRGGRTVHITLGAHNDGVLGSMKSGAVEQLRVFLNGLPAFQRHRDKTVAVHPLYAHLDDPVPATVTRIQTAPWGTSEPTTVPSTVRVEFFWQAMPGESRETVDRDFFSWFDALVQANPASFPTTPRVEFPIRWLPGSAIDENHQLVRDLATCAREVIGSAPPIQGIEGPCDMYVFHEFGMPTVLWGARGGNTHNPDEYVEIDSLIGAASTLLTFVCRWCGVVSQS